MTTKRVVGGIAVVVVGITLALLAVDWLIWGARGFSPANVAKQWAFAYQYEAALRGEAQQICNAEQALARAVNSDEQTQRRSQLLAMQNNYQRIAQEFDARLRNAFDAKLIAPPDVERRAASLAAMKERACIP